jgi:hypothetical protein
MDYLQKQGPWDIIINDGLHVPLHITSKMVTWIVHVDQKTSHEKAAYDMIIGMDLMTTISIFVNKHDKTIEWEGHAISLKEQGELQNHEALNYIHHMVNAPSIIMEVEEWQSCILDANYKAINVNEYVTLYLL